MASFENRTKGRTVRNASPDSLSAVCDSRPGFSDHIPLLGSSRRIHLTSCIAQLIMLILTSSAAIVLLLVLQGVVLVLLPGGVCR